MSDCIIVIRIPSSGRVVIIGDDDSDDPAVFKDRDEAISQSKKIPVIEAGYPFQIVELDEL